MLTFTHSFRGASRTYDIFITHAQATGQDQCKKLCLLLQHQGYRVWYDMQATDLTARGMEEGVSQSRVVLITTSSRRILSSVVANPEPAVMPQTAMMMWE